ncbi:MAG: SIR2 family NAD-dependent protein deacylase [Myxococcota bacterium]
MNLPRARDFRRVVFFTGAGLSRESGVPTYRGEGGLWHEYRPEDYACQEAFERAPDRVWDFHEKRRAFTGGCAPSDGHRCIAAFQEEFPEAWVVTQNIDGLHQRAGSRRVIELHGSLWRVRCDACPWSGANVELPLSTRLHDCGAPLRPDIVWFGDALVEEVLGAAAATIEACDLFIAIGTSAQVFPAAELPLLARARGAMLVEVNPAATPLSDVYDVSARATAQAALPVLLRGGTLS